jgi:hypothetical protein
MKKGEREFYAGMRRVIPDAVAGKILFVGWMRFAYPPYIICF